LKLVDSSVIDKLELLIKKEKIARDEIQQK